MPRLSANRLLPLLAGLAVLLTLVVALRSCSSVPQEKLVLESVPQAPAPDADTPADTINTLMANVSAMNSELTALRQDNAELQQDNLALVEDRQQIENNLYTRLQGLFDSSQAETVSAETSAAIAELASRVDSLADRLEAAPGGIAASGAAGSGLPVGLGLESAVSGSAESAWPSPLNPVPGPEPLVWIAPLEGSTAGMVQEPQGDSLPDRFGSLVNTAPDPARPQAETLTGAGMAALKPELPIYTVPRNATLVGTTGMTALVGRVPVQGQVQDPMPFKLISGKDNLAANGLRIPGIEGMIWSGTAIGDWTLSCVTGQLESVSFVFEDGTIQTLSSDDSQRGGSSGNKDGSLGWISDDRGIPCISGERKTNAPAFLAQRLGFMALEAAGEAAAQAQTATLLNNNGGATSLVSGDSGKFILGRTLSGGSEELAAWLRERQSQSFDAVFVPAGAELAIHVDRELRIDFRTQGRKLHHEENHEKLPWHDLPNHSGTDLD